MKIAYLLDRPELGGGVKVVFQHAALLAREGHRVWVTGRGPRPGWAGVDLAPNVRYLDLEESRSAAPVGAGDGPVVPNLPNLPDLPEPVDLLVATYWTTLAAARRATLPAAGGPPRAVAAVQLLQGFEPDWPHQRQRRDEIVAAYRQAALPAMVVASHLGHTLEERFGLPWHLTPPPVDRRFRPGFLTGFARRQPRRRPWVVVPGIFEAEIKGVPVALEAIHRLRQAGFPCRVLRVSVLAQGGEERALLAADRFLSGVAPERVAAALRAADLALFPALPGEGFGLPLLEAMASGVPAVASRLPSTEEMTGGTVPLVTPGDPEALAAAARDLLSAPRAWRRARREVVGAAGCFGDKHVARTLEKAVAWAVRTGAPEAAAADLGAGAT